jgi:hypothetical protein
MKGFDYDGGINGSIKKIREDFSIWVAQLLNVEN